MSIDSRHAIADEGTFKDAATRLAGLQESQAKEPRGPVVMTKAG